MTSLNTKFSLCEVLNNLTDKSPKQILSFLKTNGLTKHLSSYDIDQISWTFEFKKRLCLMNIDPDKFCEILEKYNLAVTGSFILQIIKDTTYSESDIDIFVPKLTTDIINDLYGLLNVKEKYRMGKNNTYKNVVNKKAHNIVSQLVEFQSNKYKIQLIEPHEEYGTIIKYVESFDFDICKNFFDGKKFYVNNLENIINNKTIYDEANFNDRSFNTMLHRVNKYSKRGFDIMFSSSFIRKLTNEKRKINKIIQSSGSIILETVPITRNLKWKEKSCFEIVMECMDEKYSINQQT